LLLLPILVTLWIIHRLYSALATYVIEPLAQLVLWKIQGRQRDTQLPVWFEKYAAPLIALLAVLVLLYCLGFFVRSRAVVLALDIPSATLARARREGHLRYSRRGKRTFYLGRWLID
jgi:hypothetical protein